ncbi:hypothetical protein SUGI_0720230 [Cryptomeria japonica]|nr:hypothetical protein SUGI_0720230 [Cryptomeria japonica]
MALDTSFVLECLQFMVKQGDQTSSEGKHIANVLDLSGRRPMQNAIITNMMMLENQEPLFLLQKMLEMQLSSQGMAEERVCSLGRLACIDLSPISFDVSKSSRLRIKERSHILEALYFTIVLSAGKDDLMVVSVFNG